MPTNPLTWLMRRPQTQRRDLPRWLEGDDPKPPEGVICVRSVSLLSYCNEHLLDRHLLHYLNDLRERYELAKQLTNGFRRISPWILRQHPKILRVLRLALRLTITELSDLSKVDFTDIEKLENGRYSTATPKTANRIAAVLNQLYRENNLFGRVTYEEIEQAIKTVFRLETRGFGRLCSPLKEMSTEEFLDLYRYVVEETKRFTLHPPIMLLKRPNAIAVYRVLLGIPRERFAALLGIKIGFLEKLENGAITIRYYKTAKRYADKLKKISQEYRLHEIASEEVAIKNLNALRRGWATHEELRKRAKLASERRNTSPSSITPQERKIIALLEAHGIRCYGLTSPEPKGLRCLVHGSINIGHRKYCADFVIPDAKKPRIIMEARTFSNRTKDEIFVLELNALFQLMREQYPDAKLVMILGGRDKPLKDPPPFVRNADAVFVDATLEELPLWIKQQLGEAKHQ